MFRYTFLIVVLFSWNLQAEENRGSFKVLPNQVEVIKYNGRGMTYEQLSGAGYKDKVIYRGHINRLGRDKKRSHIAYLKGAPKTMKVSLDCGQFWPCGDKAASQRLYELLQLYGKDLKILVPKNSLEPRKAEKQTVQSESPYWVKIYNTKTGKTQSLTEFVRNYDKLIKAKKTEAKKAPELVEETEEPSKVAN